MSEVKIIDSNLEEVDENAAFEIAEISGKGKCLRAKRAIRVGEVIIRERPLIHMPSEIYDLEDVNEIETWLDKRINRMTCPGRETFYNLTDARTSHQTTLGIFFTNDMNYSGDAGLFPIMSRTNHSCAPNSDFISRPDLDVQDLVAIQNIEKGEEITLSYLASEEEGCDIREVRQSYLLQWYCFKCTCTLCVLDENEVKTNDELRKKLKTFVELENKNGFELEELFSNLNRVCVKLPHHIEMCEKILDKALGYNNYQLASRSIIEGCMKASIIESPDTANWEQLRKSQMVSINGQLFLFPLTAF